MPLSDFFDAVVGRLEAVVGLPMPAVPGRDGVWNEFKGLDTFTSMSYAVSPS